VRQMIRRAKRFIAKVTIFFKSFSLKQKKVFTWWMDGSPYKDYDGIICDGAIRAGKTVCMALSYVFWAMDAFDGQNLGMCGKTVGSFQRNVWMWLKPVLYFRGYRVQEIKTPIHVITITRKGKSNYFYIFGGKDEGSQSLIQGITLAGIFFDEVALMPQSFVNQGTGRCSVEGAKFWFNCNPDAPMHWFNQEWILKAVKKRMVHIHFLMDDNPSNSSKTLARYKSNFTGVFYQRFILGLWVMAQGAIYKDAWSEELLFDDKQLEYITINAYRMRRYIFIDYGTVNPMVFLDVYDDGETLWVVREWYYDSRATGVEKTDAEHADDLEAFIKDGIAPTYIVIDPSAASFKTEIRSRRLRTKDTADLINADNNVLDGIRMVSTMMHKKRLRFHKVNCPKTTDELLSYVWDDKAIQKGLKERPIKINDHGPDAVRYGVKTLITARRLAS
jgi:PBSX family phage terminase large subunit